MIWLALALLRGFARDRGTMLFALLAPVAFTGLFGLFYAHLDASNGTRFEIALRVPAESSPMARSLAESIVRLAVGRLRIEVLTDEPEDPAGFDGFIRIPSDAGAPHARVEIESRFPLPGLNDALHLLVLAAAAEARADRDAGPPSEADRWTPAIDDRTRPGRLLRGNAAAIPVLFVLFSLSSLVGRGLGEDSAGFRDRLVVLGLPRQRQALASVLALSAIGLIQMSATFVLLGLGFGVWPDSPLGLAAALLVSALACASFVSLVAELCGSRPRFAAVAPVTALLLGGLSGSMVPIEILPDGLAAPSRWLFTRWSIEACAAAVGDGRVAPDALRLAAWTAGCLAALWLVASARRRPLNEPRGETA